MFMAFSRRIARSSQKLGDDTRGAILPIFAVMSLVVIVVAGAGIDYGRAINDREVMVNALDASALAVAAELSTSIMTDDEIGEMLEEVFAANLTSLGLSEAAVANMDFTVDPDEGVVSVSTSISVPTYFIGLGGIGPDSIDVASSTEVNYSKFDVELALVLDVTGSMRNDIDTLQEASTQLLDTLIPEGTSASDTKVRISIVPYSQGVNLGSYADDVTNGSAEDDCATERAGEAQFTDDAYDYTPDDETLIENTYFGGGTDNCPSGVELLPLSNDRDTIQDTIDDLDDGGYTAGQTGIQWGWYTLSPNWTNLWPADSDPGAYSDEDLLKFAVIMTDGDFNRYYELEEEEVCSSTYGGRGGGRSGGRDDDDDDDEDVCEIVSEWSQESESESYTNTSSTRAIDMCAAMKSAGIEVYSIYFGTNSSSAGAKVMSDCANDSSTFYMATSSDDLINAFGNIAKKIQAIYLAK